uniref:Putative secreted protein n=1 Tax=Ixodes ricinus TaxID=34613 RepID=A0A6B0UME3_IXORI
MALFRLLCCIFQIHFLGVLYRNTLRCLLLLFHLFPRVNLLCLWTVCYCQFCCPLSAILIQFFCRNNAGVLYDSCNAFIADCINGSDNWLCNVLNRTCILFTVFAFFFSGLLDSRFLQRL